MATVKDPVCGMMIDSDTAPYHVAHEDHTHYFCSKNCRDKFQADRAAYGDLHDEPRWTTEGKMTAPKYGAAGSGGLEYESLPPGVKD